MFTLYVHLNKRAAILRRNQSNPNQEIQDRGRNSNTPSECIAHTSLAVIPIAVRVSRASDIVFRFLIPWYSIEWIIISRKIGLEERKVIIIINVRNLSWISNRTLFRFFWDAGWWSLADVLSFTASFMTRGYLWKSVLWTSIRKSVCPRGLTTWNSVHRRQRLLLWPGTMM